jgi:threonine dehydratase
MTKPTLAGIKAARARTADYVHRTPLHKWGHLQKLLGFEAPVFLKLDSLQNTGSFKVRGGANKILRMCEEGRAPDCLVAASAGNHAQAVAFVGGRLGIPAKIVMPEGTPIVKAKATADYGAEVILHGILYDDAYARAREILAATPGAAYIHAYEDIDVIEGQGTMGLEIDEQLREAGVDAEDVQVVIPIGGGGLICGVGSALRALRSKLSVFGVVSQVAPAMADSLRQGRVTQAPPGGGKRTLAEGLAVKKVSELTFGILKEFVEQIAIVGDDEVAAAIALLMERAKVVAEGAGAAGIAALLSGKLTLDPKRPTVIVLCGGNIDMNLVSNILERGLAKNGRWLSMTITVEDKPGELARISKIIGGLRGNVLEVFHDRISARCPVGYTLIRLQLETNGPDHVREIRAALESEGFAIIEG